MTTDDGMDVVVTETPSATIARQAAEIERLRDKLVEYMNETQVKTTEIERLRKDVTHWREARRSCIQAGDMMKAEIERLSLALANAKISFDAIDATLAERDAEIERLRGLLRIDEDETSA